MYLVDDSFQKITLRFVVGERRFHTMPREDGANCVICFVGDFASGGVVFEKYHQPIVAVVILVGVGESAVCFLFGVLFYSLID